MKKLIVCILCLLVIAPTIMPALAKEAEKNIVAEKFNDVESDKWYTEAVQYVYDNGIMVGLTNESFGVDETLTRAQAVTILYAMAGKPDTYSKNTIPFKDCKEDEWYSEAVKWAAAGNIVYGVGLSKFEPEAKIIRADLAVMLIAYVREQSIKLPIETPKMFSDKIPEYARIPTNILSAAKIITGKPSNLFCPSDNATRGEVAVIISNLAKKSEAQDIQALADKGWSFGGAYIKSRDQYSNDFDFVFGFKRSDSSDPEKPIKISAAINTLNGAPEIEFQEQKYLGVYSIEYGNELDINILSSHRQESFYIPNIRETVLLKLTIEFENETMEYVFFPTVTYLGSHPFL